MFFFKVFLYVLFLFVFVFYLYVESVNGDLIELFRQVFVWFVDKLFWFYYVMYGVMLKLDVEDKKEMMCVCVSMMCEYYQFGS